MRLNSPGSAPTRSTPGTWTTARRRRRYSEGVAPTRRANRPLKLPRLEKPTSMHTSVTEAARREEALGRSRRGGAEPVRRHAERGLEQPDEVERRDAASRATCSMVSGSSCTSTNRSRARHRRLNTSCLNSIGRHPAYAAADHPGKHGRMQVCRELPRPGGFAGLDHRAARWRDVAHFVMLCYSTGL